MFLMTYLGSYLIAGEARGRLFYDVVVTSLSQVFIIVVICVWLIPVKEIEHQSFNTQDLLVKTECCNEPDAAALK